MDDYDSDLMRESFKYDGDEPETAWQLYRSKFALADRSARIGELRLIDGWLSDPKPTRETSSTWLKKRDLLALHHNLIRLGR